MTLYRTIENQIQKSVAEFCHLLAEKHSLSEEELLDTWKTVAGAPATNKKTNKKGDKKPRKSSAWQNFAKATRPLVKAEMPDLSFGETSSEIGRRWRSLSENEKAQYASKAATPKPVATEINSPATTTPSIKNTPVVVASPVKSPSPLKTKSKKKQAKKVEADEEASPYEKMLVKELKALCKEKGLTIKGLTKKVELLEALRIADEANHSSDDDDDDDDNGSVASDETSSSYHPDLEEEEDDLLA